MKIQHEIESRLKTEFAPSHLEVVNESYKHLVPEGSESHFKVLVVSEKFTGQNRVSRQRKVNEVLSDLLAGPVHALAQRALTPEEWQGSSDFRSPDCASKKHNHEP